MGGMRLGWIWVTARMWRPTEVRLAAPGGCGHARPMGATRGRGYQVADLPEERGRRCRPACKREFATTRMMPPLGTITLDGDRARAIASVAARYQSLFGNDPATSELREAYAMMNNTVPDAEYRRALTAFFWWTAWATVTERPGSHITYTNNWPSEPLVGNRASSQPICVVGLQRDPAPCWHCPPRLASCSHRGVIGNHMFCPTPIRCHGSWSAPR